MSSGKYKPKVSGPSLPTPEIDDRYIPIRWPRNETRGVVNVMKMVSDYQRERRLIEIRKTSTESKGWSTSIRLTNLRAGRASSKENVYIWRVPGELTQESTCRSLVGKNDSVDVVGRAQGTRLNHGR